MARAVTALEVARNEGLDVSRMRGVSRDRESSRGRLMTAWLARDVGKIPVARSAKYFGRAGVTLILGLNRLVGSVGSSL